MTLPFSFWRVHQSVFLYVRPPTVLRHYSGSHRFANYATSCLFVVSHFSGASFQRHTNRGFRIVYGFSYSLRGPKVHALFCSGFRITLPFPLFLFLSMWVIVANYPSAAMEIPCVSTISVRFDTVLSM